MSMFSRGQLPLSSFVGLLRQGRCTRQIDVGQKNGAVFATCNERLAQGVSCSKCRQHVVFKLSKEAVNPTSVGARVFPHEAKVLRQVTEALDGLGREWSTYKTHVITLLDFATDGAGETVLVSKLVRTSGSQPKNLRDLIRSSSCKQSELVAIIIEVFMTLDVIQRRVPGFVHMDLLTPQIFLSDWPASSPSNILPVNRTMAFVVPKQRFWPVLGDFGTAYTDAHPQSASDYAFDKKGPGFINVGQDIFRFFLGMYTDASTQSTRAFIRQIADEVFRGRFAALIDMRDEFGYLPAAIVKKLNFKYYSDVLTKISAVAPYFKRIA